MNSAISSLMTYLQSNVSENTTVASTVSAATILTGFAGFLDIIAGPIAVIATLAGIVLTTVLTISHLKKMVRDARQEKRSIEKYKIEIDILKKERDSIDDNPS